MNKELFFYTLCFGLSSLVLFRQTLMYFQQNRYESYRYLSWLNKFYLQHLFLVPAYLFILRELLDQYLNIDLTYYYLLIGCLVVRILIEFRKKYIKPLVITKRVKRQIFTLSIIYLILWFLGYYFKADIMTLIGLEFISWFLIMIMHFINWPLEKIIERYYLNQAKQILRNHSNLIKIGITGSYGKTSSKHVLNTVLNQGYYCYATPRSINTPMGITTYVRNELKNIHEVFVCEMGADKKGEITALMKFVRPSIGVVTNIGPQHLNTFKNIENIIHEKMQEIELLPKDGLAVINLDNEYIRNYQIKNDVKTVSFSIQDPSATYYAYDLNFDINGVSFKVKLQDQEYLFRTKLLSYHNISNCLVAIAIADYLGLTPKQIQVGLSNLDYVKHRLELKKINNFNIIDNSFNSNPVSAKLALETLKQMPYQRIIMTPGFIDLGKEEAKYNYQFGCLMKESCDFVMLVGKNQTKDIYQGLKDSGFNLDQVLVFDSVKEAFEYLYQHFKAQDTIVLIENDLPDAFNH